MFHPESALPSLLDIEERLAMPDVAALPLLRLAVLRNVTMESIEPYLQYMACEMGFRADVHFGGFDNFVQESLGGAPGVLQGELDAVLLFTPLPALSPAFDSGFAVMSPVEINNELDRLSDLFATVVNGIRAQTGAMILWHGMEAPVYPTLGIQDGQLQLGQTAVVAKLNEALRVALTTVANACFVNMQACLSRLGAQQFYDTRYWHIARAPYSRKGLGEIAREDFKFIRSIKGRTRKCLVLDCDNTLWGGIVGEDGLEGIRLGSTHPGSAFVEFQKEVLALYHRGVILAICSKNNEEDVWEVFDRHPDMILKREHIAAWRINWDNKAGNLRALASELNIGGDSMVFADDSDFEINLVREQLPEVMALQLPKQRPGDYRWVLAACGAFDLPYITEEDRKRGALYQAESVRTKERAGSTDLESYCRSLDMVLEIGRADEFSTPRIAQQTQKTNQFNLTTRRYTEADIQKFSSSADHDVFWLKVTDKFGDMGIVGSLVIAYRGADAVVDTLLLSCRALGRGVEARFLFEVAHLARKHGAKRMVGHYIPTSKNVQVANFYTAQGFVNEPAPEGEDGGFVLDLATLKPLEPGVFASVLTPLSP